MKKMLFLLTALLMAVTAMAQTDDSRRVVVAYVTSWSDVMPDPSTMTHINYAFGKVRPSFDGVDVDNPERLKTIVALKTVNPSLKVLLSVGGWGAGNFSEMAADKRLRRSFARDCRRVVEEFGLDGIDIDWEYPTQNSADISCSPDDTQNFTLLMRDLRKALGKDHLLTCATVASGKYIDFPSCIKYVDLVNIMAYDMGNPPYHHSALYASEISRFSSCEAVIAHIHNGVPADKIVLGMPFYGRGDRKYRLWEETHAVEGVTERWSDSSLVPYLVDEQGKLVYGFENAHSLGIKCQFILDNGLRGAMYWEYSDDTQGDKRSTLARMLLGR